jgi:hypothetical protein
MGNQPKSMQTVGFSTVKSMQLEREFCCWDLQVVESACDALLTVIEKGSFR